MWEKSYHTELFTKRNFSLDSIACYNIRVSNNCLKPIAIGWIVVSTSQYGIRLEELLSRTSFLSFLQVATSKRCIYANDCKASTSVKHDTLNSLSTLSVNLVYLTLPTSKRQELQHIFT